MVWSVCVLPSQQIAKMDEENMSMFVIDSILLEEKTQDRIAVLCIIDSAMERIFMELPQCDVGWIVTDNALAY